MHRECVGHRVEELGPRASHATRDCRTNVDSSIKGKDRQRQSARPTHVPKSRRSSVRYPSATPPTKKIVTIAVGFRCVSTIRHLHHSTATTRPATVLPSPLRSPPSKHPSPPHLAVVPGARKDRLRCKPSSRRSFGSLVVNKHHPNHHRRAIHPSGGGS